MSAERPDGFEEELVVRLGARAAVVGGSPPLAELRAAGRRRTRRRAALRGVAALVLLAAGAGALGQLGGGGRRSSEASSVGSPAGEAAPWWKAGPVDDCTAGPDGTLTPVRSPSLSPTGAPSGTPSSVGAPLSPGGYPGAADASSPSSPTSSGRSTPVDQRDWFPSDQGLYQAAREVADLAVGPYAEAYFGMCDDQAARILYVMRKPGSGLDAAVRERATVPDVRIEFRDAVGTRAELGLLAQQISQDGRAYWRPRGITTVQVVVGAYGLGVQVYVEQATESVRAEFAARYGPRVVVLDGNS
ncbi:hypothetical protein AB0O91_39120 [Kitasatospora sp. NPDC089797]|uniref:hypothetical protein n=1 Tax=Kitasatospora sp. NPDC089797 TaxID=3155298 RepID=UPI003415B0C5